MDRDTVILVAVAINLSLTVLHGLVHAAIPVFPTGWTAPFAAITLYALPMAGAGIVTRGRHRIGSAVLLTAGIAAVTFEGTFHFLITNPDHVAVVAEHSASFGVTALLTTAGDLLLIVAACVGLRVPISLRNPAFVTVDEMNESDRLD